MVEHIVLFKLKQGVTGEQKVWFVKILKKLKELEGIENFSVGINDSKEGKDKGVQVGMRILFSNQEALERYVPSQEHVSVVDEIRFLIDDVIVVDYSVT